MTRNVDADWLAFLKRDFTRGFPAFCGMAVVGAAWGEFETHLEVRDDHRQQDGFVHAGVMATMADHTAGYAAFTTVGADRRILSIEFKINFLRPARGEAVVCRARILKPGRTIIPAEAEIVSVQGAAEKSVAKAMVTLMAVPADELALATLGPSVHPDGPCGQRDGLPPRGRGGQRLS